MAMSLIRFQSTLLLSEFLNFSCAEVTTCTAASNLIHRCIAPMMKIKHKNEEGSIWPRHLKPTTN
jgi:hypothetical protein